MATYREIVYMCLDEIKSSNGDSSITEEHVMFLANQYRLFLLEQKKKQEGAQALSQSNEQTICVNLEQADAVPGLDYCNETYLRSEEEVPDTISDTTVNIQWAEQFNYRTAFVTKNRFKYVGFNKYLRNIVYCTLGDDKHLYFKSNNPQFLYVDTAKVTGIFEDSEEAAKLACDQEGEDTKCDILDQKFPLDGDMIPQLIQLIVKELLGALYRPEDSVNNSNDDIADLMTYIRKNMKSNFAKQLDYD